MAVDGLRGAFIANWVETGDIYIKSFARDTERNKPDKDEVMIQVILASASAGWSDMSTLFHVLIQLATKALKISTAYFVPDEKRKRNIINRVMEYLLRPFKTQL